MNRNGRGEERERSPVAPGQWLPLLCLRGRRHRSLERPAVRLRRGRDLRRPPLVQARLYALPVQQELVVKGAPPGGDRGGHLREKATAKG